MTTEYSFPPMRFTAILKCGGKGLQYDDALLHCIRRSTMNQLFGLPKHVAMAALLLVAGAPVLAVLVTVLGSGYSVPEPCLQKGRLW